MVGQQRLTATLVREKSCNNIRRHVALYSIQVRRHVRPECYISAAFSMLSRRLLSASHALAVVVVVVVVADGRFLRGQAAHDEAVPRCACHRLCLGRHPRSPRGRSTRVHHAYIEGHAAAPIESTCDVPFEGSVSVKVVTFLRGGNNVARPNMARFKSMEQHWGETTPWEAWDVHDSTSENVACVGNAKKYGSAWARGTDGAPAHGGYGQRRPAYEDDPPHTTLLDKRWPPSRCAANPAKRRGRSGGPRNGSTAEQLLQQGANREGRAWAVYVSLFVLAFSSPRKWCGHLPRSFSSALLPCIRLL